jgi:hypothetical protein
MIIRAATAALFALLGIATAEAAEWVPCARENGYCRVPYPTVVRYGARGAFADSRVEGGIGCNNDSFGDPIHGVPKACFYLAQDRGWNRPPPPPPRNDWNRPPRDEWSGGGGWQPCAREGSYCDFRGRGLVRYGARGSYVTMQAVNGISCDNDTFGRDPISGVTKHCEVRR